LKTIAESSFGASFPPDSAKCPIRDKTPLAESPWRVEEVERIDVAVDEAQHGCRRTMTVDLDRLRFERHHPAEGLADGFAHPPLGRPSV